VENKRVRSAGKWATVGKGVPLLFVLAGVLLLGSVGCGTLRPYQARSGLSAATPHPELLTSVSSVEVEPPTQERTLSVPVRDFHTMISGSWNEFTILKVVTPQEVAAGLAPDALLTTHFMSYEDRVGSSIGALQPARVGFIQRLVKVPTGEVIWEARFSHTDHSATDNLLDTEGSGWHTPYEVAKAGFSVAAQNASSSVDQYFERKR
jgi:hypothetical protein